MHIEIVFLIISSSDHDGFGRKTLDIPAARPFPSATSAKIRTHE
jgi:hypothetical protein